MYRKFDEYQGNGFFEVVVFIERQGGSSDRESSGTVEAPYILKNDVYETITEPLPPLPHMGKSRPSFVTARRALYLRDAFIA